MELLAIVALYTVAGLTLAGTFVLACWVVYGQH